MAGSVEHSNRTLLETGNRVFHPSGYVRGFQTTIESASALSSCKLDGIKIAIGKGGPNGSPWPSAATDNKYFIQCNSCNIIISTLNVQRERR